MKRIQYSSRQSRGACNIKGGTIKKVGTYNQVGVYLVVEPGIRTQTHHFEPCHRRGKLFNQFHVGGRAVHHVVHAPFLFFGQGQEAMGYESFSSDGHGGRGHGSRDVHGVLSNGVWMGMSRGCE